MPQTPEREALDALLDDLQRGRADEVLDEILEVANARKAERDKWQPINDLVEMLRRIELSAGDTMEAKARTGVEMNMALKPFLASTNPAVRGLATGVQQSMAIKLLGVTPDQAAKLSERR